MENSWNSAFSIDLRSFNSVDALSYYVPMTGAYRTGSSQMETCATEVNNTFAKWLGLQQRKEKEYRCEL